MQHSNREFGLVRLEEEAHFEDMVFDACKFFRCVIEPRAIRRCLNLDNRIVFSNCQVRNCVQDRCLIGPAIFHRCLVDGLQSQDGGMRIDGAFFDQVTLRGDVGTFRVLPDATGGVDPPFDLALYQANRELYAGVNWAIDITDAFSDELELYGMPPELIRYDPTRQAIIRRKSVEASYSESIKACAGTYFGVCIGNLQYFPTADNVCFAIPTTGDVGRHQQVLAELRSLGFAD